MYNSEINKLKYESLDENVTVFKYTGSDPNV